MTTAGATHIITKNASSLKPSFGLENCIEIKLDLETLKKIFLHVTCGHLVNENFRPIAIRQAVKVPIKEEVLAFKFFNLKRKITKNDNVVYKK